MQNGSGAQSLTGNIVVGRSISVAPGFFATVEMQKEGSYHVVFIAQRGAAGAASAFTVNLLGLVTNVSIPIAPPTLVPAAPANTVTRIVWEHVVHTHVSIVITVDAAAPAAITFSWLQLTATPT